MKQPALGKGLDILFSQETLTSITSHEVLDINKIEPNYQQPRKKFSDQDLDELTLSIKEHGIIQPIIVTQKNDKYQIIAGERRYRAARLLDLKEVPVRIKKVTSDEEVLELALIENIQRADLDSIELAEAFDVLVNKYGQTHEQIAKKLGKNRATITNILRLNTLCDYTKQKIRENLFSEGHAKAILKIKDEVEQQRITDMVINNNWSVRALENYINKITANKLDTISEKDILVNALYKDIEEKLKLTFGTKVKLSQLKDRGKIEIEYYSDEDLERILGAIH
ncbi:MAG: hypothetical protein BEN19_02100 [Epulopiscium sp. Nuni2H_MBin003]|nr:MAG: hypothetical protein BEN19_02100 [Epulopiscium sp. Nuni2H_MBin003]